MLFKYALARCTLNCACNKLISRDRLGRIQICWTLDILQPKCKIIRRAFRGKRKLHFQKPSQQNWLRVEMDKLQKPMHPHPTPFISLSNCRGGPLAPHPSAGHMSPTSVTWWWRRQHWAGLLFQSWYTMGPWFPVVEHCHEVLQASAHYIAHPSLHCLELYMCGAHTGLFFCWAKCSFP